MKGYSGFCTGNDSTVKHPQSGRRTLEDMAEISDSSGGIEKVNRDLLLTDSPSTGTGWQKLSGERVRPHRDKESLFHIWIRKLQTSPLLDVVERKVYIALKSDRQNSREKPLH